MYSTHTSYPERGRSAYPMLWALYLISFLVIAHCLDASVDGAWTPSLPGKHLAAVMGLTSYDSAPCGDSCRVQQAGPGSTGLGSGSPASTCTEISVHPGIGAGCGSSLDAEPTPGTVPSPSDDLSASAPEELPPPADNPSFE